MNINASIIDQRLIAIVDLIRDQAAAELKITEETRLKSLGFVYLCVKTMLDLTDDEAFECLTEGGGDFGVDAMHISEEHDGEFIVSLFQGKYSKDLEGKSNFSENGIKALITAINQLFNPSSELQHINPRLRARVEEARSLIRDGYIPNVRVLACNNGLPWNDAAQQQIDNTGFGAQVIWEHINHDRLVKILQAPKQVDDTLQLSGKAIVEDMNYSRVLVGRISVHEIAAVIKRHGEQLLERNIRRYLGLQGNRVNEGIRDTLQSQESSNFYFFNNGITLTCNKFSYNALQSGDFQVRVENLQIINGGQTCMTIFKTLYNKDGQLLLFTQESPAYVLIRLYQLPSDNEDLVRRITFATNSQNPVDLRDLRANDERQQQLEMDIEQLGYKYRRKRTDLGIRQTDITSSAAAEAILAVWRKRPHQAKFFTREHFGKLYDIIFRDDLTGAQVIIAVLLYRIAENRRRRPQPDDSVFVRYASCFIAMLMGEKLVNDLGIGSTKITHRNFEDAKNLVENKGDEYFNESVKDIEAALRALYGEIPDSLQQLSATFRRGDLMDKLNILKMFNNNDVKP